MSAIHRVSPCSTQELIKWRNIKKENSRQSFIDRRQYSLVLPNPKDCSEF